MAAGSQSAVAADPCRLRNHIAWVAFGGQLTDRFRVDREPGSADRVGRRESLGLNVVKVSVADVRVEHEVRLMDFTKWLDKTGGSPREVSDRYKIRSILGMPVPR